MQFGGRGETTNKCRFVGFTLELPQLFMLLEIDLVWIDRPTGKIEHGRFSSGHKLIDFLNCAGLGNPGAGAKLGPKHPKQQIGAGDQLAIDRVLWSYACLRFL